MPNDAESPPRLTFQPEEPDARGWRLLRLQLRTVWLENKRRLLYASIAALAIVLVLETIHQVRVQKAIGHASRKEYKRVLAALEKEFFGLFRNGRAEALGQEARYHIAIGEAAAALEQMNWPAAKSSLNAALESGDGASGRQEEIEKLLDAWKQGMQRLLAGGEHTRCREALDMLAACRFEGDPLENQVRQLVGAAAAELARGFSATEAWIPALHEAQRARESLDDGAGGAGDPLEAVRDHMSAALQRALDAGDFERSKSILRLLDSHFPGGRPGGSPQLQQMQYLEALARAQQEEASDSFDAALAAYELALTLRPGDREAFQRLAKLRERMRSYSRSAGVWVRREAGQGITELEEAQQICARAPAQPLTIGRSKQPVSELRDLHIRGGAAGLEGRWDLFLDEAGARWLIEVEVSFAGQYQKSAHGGTRIGVLLLDSLRRPLAAKVHEIPLLLGGEIQRVKLQVPKHEQGAFIAVGLRS
jgi:hypothetical protein